METVDLSKLSLRQLKRLRKMQRSNRVIPFCRETVKQLDVAIKEKQVAYNKHVKSVLERLLYFCKVNNKPPGSVKMNFHRKDK